MQFYETDAFLLELVGDFLGAGVGAGTPCIVIATPEHRAGLAHHLQDHGVVLATAQAQGQYLALDAAETLAQFMVDGMPDPARFRSVIGGLVERAATGPHPVRLFGEMVALLWAEGHQMAAVELEALWEELRSSTVPFSLLCAYPMTLFAEATQLELFTRMCALHTQVIPDEGFSRLNSPEEQLRVVSQFRQKALVLETELVAHQAAQERLRLSEHRYRRLFESSTDGILLVDPLSGRIIDANPAFLQLVGATLNQIVGQELWHVGLLPDQATQTGFVRQVQQEHVVRYEPLTLPTSIGESIQVEWVSTLFQAEGHEVLQCNLRDLTDRRRAEEARVHLAAIVSSSDDAILSKDLDGSITSWNAAAERLFGYTEEEIIGQPVSRLFPPDRQDEFTRIMEQLRRGERVDHYETWRVRKDGSLMPVSVTVSPVRDHTGAIIGASDITRDISSRKAAEATRQLLAAIVSSSEDAIFSKNLDGIITSWNAAAERLFGYPAHEIVGQSVTRLFPPDHQDEFAQIMDGIRRGECIEHHETVRVRRDGDLVPVSVTISPVKDDQGEIVGASDITHDISTRVAFERQREAVISLVTHELKTPITSLQTSIQLAQRRLNRLLVQAEQQESEQQQLLEQVLTMLGRTQHPLRVQQRLIDDLMDLSHLQEGKMEVHLEHCDLVGVVAETVQDQQSAHPARLITLDVPDTDPILVWADPDRLQQVLSNYLTNALKFSPEDEPVQVGITLEAEAVRVWVRDHGPGLSDEQQHHIWQQFYQAPHTPVQRGWKPGLGLGLYISQQLIRRQQGQVGVESRPGEGATFWFTLPLAPPLVGDGVS